LDGTFFAAGSSVILFNAGTFTYVPGNRLTGPGQYQFFGAILQGLNDYLPNLQLLGGTVYLSNNYQTNGVIVRLDLNGATLGNASNRVVGVLNAINGGISGALEITSNAVANLNGTYLYGATFTRAYGTVNWLAGRFAQGSSWLIETKALVNMLTSGEKDIGGLLSNYGRVIWTGGTIYVMNDNQTWLGGILNLGAWEMQGDVSLAQYWAYDFAGVLNGGLFHKTAGTGSGIINVPFTNSAGTLEALSGALRFDHGEQLDGLFIAGAGAAIQFNSGTFTYTPATWLTGTGVFQLTGGTLVGLPDFLPNLQLVGGTVYLSPIYQTNGSIVRLDLNGSTLGGAAQVSGVLNFNSGFIGGPLTVNSNGVLNWSSGRFAQGSSLLVASNGVVNLQTTGYKELGGGLTNFGTVSWSGGTLNMLNDGVNFFGTILNTGLWDMVADLPVTRNYANDYPVFENTGLLRKSAGSGTSAMDIVALNEGRIEALSGVMLFTRGLSSTAKVTFGLSSSGSFGQISVSGTASLNGSLGARLLNGYIPSVGQGFQVLNAASVAGTLTNILGLNVGFGRQLVPVFTPTNLTLQTIATNGLNNPPTWTSVPNFNVIEGQTLLYTNQVNDPNGDQVLFSLLLAPTGATLNLTNGILSWTPTEAQGGTSNYFIARIFDSGNPSMGATQSFSVIVLKTNSAPVLPVIPSQLIGVGGVLTVTNTATDTDVPANTLAYALISPPSGMTVDANGIITWPPSNAGSYQITMKVTDNGTPPLSATNGFIVGVLAAPTPPSGLISWWTGDGTTADKNGANNGALSGTASYSPGLFGQAFNFNGGYLTVLDSASLDLPPGSPMTIEMWVKRNSSGSVPYYFGKRVGCGAYNYQSPSDLFTAGTAYDAPVGVWRHFAWVFTGTDMLGYVNGALVYRIQNPVGPTNNAALFIGTSGTCGSSLVGLIDEARIYNRALSPSEIQSVYNGQSVGAPVVTQQPSSQLASSGINVALVVGASGAAPLSYQWLYNGAPLAGKTTATLTLTSVTAAQSGNYSVAVSNAVGSTTSSTAELTVLDAPAITLQPQSQAGSVGGSVIFTVAATGGAPLDYSWRKNGIALGITGSALTLSNLQLSDAGSYDVIAHNWVGSQTSQVATLTVNGPLFWTGAISSDWFNRTNWSPQQVPTSTDTAVVTNGNITLSSPPSFFALTFSAGTIAGPLVVASNSVMNWSGGRLGQGSSLSVNSNGFVNMTTSAEKDLGGPMTNFGRVVLAGSSFYVMNDNSTWFGTITNPGVWELQGDYSVAQYWNYNYCTFANAGVLRKTAGGGQSVIGLPFTNSLGTMDARSGTLRFDFGGRLDGTFVTTNGTFITFNSGTFIYVPPGHFSGPGQFQFTGGTLQGLDDYVPNLQLLGGMVILSATYQTNGSIVRLDLNGATLGNTNNRVAGVLNAFNGAINGSLEVASNGVASLNGTYLYGASVVRSNGTMNWSAGRFGQGSSLLVESGGLINMPTTGEKDIGGPMYNYGRVVWGGGTIYLMNDNATWLGRVVNLGSWELQGDASLAEYWAYNYDRFDNGGNFIKSAGTGTSVVNVPFYNQYGAVQVLSGTLRFDHGQQLDGLFDVEADATMQFNNGTFTYTPPGRFQGAGQYILTGGSFVGLNDFLPNWQFQGGTLSLSPSFQTNGPIARLDLNGATLAGSNLVSGVLNFNSGFISGPLLVNSNAVLNWNGGRFAQGSSLVVASNGLVNMLTIGEKDLGGPMTNSGTVAWTGGALYVMNDGASWAGTIQNFGLWDERGDLQTYRWFGGDNPVFRNNGIFRKSVGTGTSGMDVITTNQSVIEALTGTINFSRGLSSTTGTVTFGVGNTAYGQIGVAGTANVNGSLTARLLGGFIPNVGQSYPVLSAGSLSGIFTDTNGLAVGFGRVFSASYTATTLSLQAAATNGVNNPPSWTLVPNFTITEGQTLLYTNQVSDPDGNQVLFQFLTAPVNAVLNLTNGILSFTPSETQGGTSNYFTVRIFDSGNPSLGATQSFYVLVVETNTAPVLGVIPTQLVGVNNLLTVSNSAVDLDLPANTLTYSLLTPPAGMSVDTNGTITWTPTSPGNFAVTMKVTDNGTPPLSATNSFSVGVIAAPTPPSGLVSWWTGDGTTADKNGINDGALTDGAGYGPGIFGQAFNFTGGYFTIPDSTSLDFAPGAAMSVEMWVKRTQAGPIPYYFGKRIGCGSYNYESPSDLAAGAWWDLPVGQWQHLAWVFAGTEMLAYVNGALVYHTELALGPPNSVPLLLGASGTCGQSFIGLVDEARLYNRALSGAEISALFGAQNVGAPVLIQQPTNRLAASGTTVVLPSAATGAAPLNYQWYYNGAPLSGKTSANLTLPAVVITQSGNYMVVVSNSIGTAASDVAALTILDPPVITVNPQSQVGVVGGTVTFNVVATGTPTPSLSYQWRKGGVPMIGQVTNSLTLNNLQVSDSGSYDVVVSNWVGAATSASANLLVSTPIVWTGAVSSDWHNRTNWNPQQVPTSSDTALINAGSVVLDTNSQFLALTFNGGSLLGAINVASNSLFYWNGGKVGPGGSLTLASNSVAYLASATEKDLGGPMTNYGRVVLSGTLFYVVNDNASNKGTVTNLGIWEVQGDLALSQFYGNGFGGVGNSGTFRKTVGTGTSVIGVPFTNGPAGVVDVETGTMRFDSGMVLGGTFFAAAGTIMAFNSGTFVFTPPVSFTGAGQFQLLGGTLQGLNDYVPGLQLLGGTVFLSPGYQTNGLIARLDINGATLGGTSNRVIGVLNATNGAINGALDVVSNAVLNMDGTYLYGATTIRSNATFNWFSGRFAQGSSLLVQSNAAVNLLGAGEKDMGGPMLAYSHVVMSGGTIYVMNDNNTWMGSITNFGYWELQGDVSIQQYWAYDFAGLANNGVLRKTAGTGTAVVNVPFFNTLGTVDVESGTIRFDHGFKMDGTFVTGSGTVMAFNNGTFVYVPPASRFGGAGSYQLTGGTLQGLDNYLPNLQLLGGTVFLSPSYQTNGPIVRLDLAGATLAGSNVVVGLLNATNGNLSGPLVIASNAVANLNGTYAFGATIVRSNATLNWLGGRFAQGSPVLIESNGSANLLTAGEKDIGGPMTNFGHVVWSGGTIYIMNDTNTWFGSITNPGVWDMQGDVTLAQYWNYDLGGFGNKGAFRKTAGTSSGAISLPFSNAAGTVDVASGSLRFDHGESLDGLFTAEVNGVIQFNNGTFLYTPQTHLTGSGLYQLTGSGYLQGLLDYLPNLQMLGGTVLLSPTYQTNGLIVRLDLNGSTLAASNRVSGVLNLNSGFIGGPLSVSSNGVLNWSSGRFASGSSLNINPGGLANLLTTGTKELGGLMANGGQVEWTQGTLTLINDANSFLGAIVNTGLFEVQGDLLLNQYTVNNYSSFQNNGTLRKPSGGGTAILDVVFINQGVVEQLSGIWTFGRNFSLTSGTVLFGIGGDTTFGQINLTGTASLAGRLAARLLNGYVPATNRTFQVMSYGVVAGTFTDYSGLDVGSGRAFAPIYSANALTLQTYATNSTGGITPIVLSNPGRNPSGFSFLFTGDVGITYTVQYCTNLTSSSVWTTLLVTNIPVSPARVTDTSPVVGRRFYRVCRAGTAATTIVLSKPVRTANQFSFLFTGDVGTTYAVQYSTNMTSNSWSTLLVTNMTVSPTKAIDANPPAARRFYRVFR
jgi:hypothetical protein